ncbi:MAG TPA: tRNA 2-thiouridine(34) synthase MnmA [Candidatus Omnitrophota bacterium]|nr:tRNA 2-thiouridine(34) synthase MnmA [Candidatus Omnitrophota bacterium]
MKSTATKKVLVAMSGGVDSSVAAALLKEQGYDLIGITMNLYCGNSAADRGCCSLSAAADAKKVADLLGFPHYTLNFKDEFQKLVIDNFIEEYRNGRTPNPCVRCNQFIKFDHLLKKAKELGAEYIATGHYARIIPVSALRITRYELLKGLDHKKDQSYVLYTLNQEMLAHTIFPLGNFAKPVVRELANKFKLPVAEKPESQDICFVEDNDYGSFLRKHLPDAVRPGPILDRSGNIVGEHNGIIHYTIGQRSGIGAHTGRKYVTAIDPASNTVTIGEDADLFKDTLIASNVTTVSGEFFKTPVEVAAKVRYNSAEAGGKLFPIDKDRIELKFNKPQRAITPGQSVVFYQGEAVLGGGIIEGGK